MPTDAKMGLLVPSCFAAAPPNMEAYTRFFRRADDLGFHSLWVIDRIFHRINIMEPLTLLTCAATVTTRIRLGTSVILSLFRNPVQLAKTTATLDYLSGGRVTLGISLGGWDNEFEAMGIAKGRRVSLFRENLTLMRKLWAETDVTHHGRFYHMDNVNVWPKPLQKPGIPIIIGAYADAALKRSAEHADGWVAGTGNQETFRQARQKVQDYARGAGKNPDSLDSGKVLYICMGKDREQCAIRRGQQLRLWDTRTMRGENSGLHRRRRQDYDSGSHLAGCCPDRPHCARRGAVTSLRGLSSNPKLEILHTTVSKSHPDPASYPH